MSKSAIAIVGQTFPEWLYHFHQGHLKREMGILFLQVHEEFGYTTTALISAKRLAVVPTVAFALSVEVSTQEGYSNFLGTA